MSRLASVRRTKASRIAAPFGMERFMVMSFIAVEPFVRVEVCSPGGGEVPRYFFHYFDGETVEADFEGLQFPSLEAAVADAKAAATEIMVERMLSGREIGAQRFEIANEDGVVLTSVAFRSVLNLQ